MATQMPTQTPARILEAARDCLLREGYAGLSTRKVAEEAGVPLSQIHYHFGGRRGMVLALLEEENRRLLERQREMYGQDVPLWKRYEQACDFLDQDVGSGYVRVLQELIAAGWTHPDLAQEVLRALDGWVEVLEDVCGEAAERFGSLGPLRADELAMLVAASFLGAEELILLGDEPWARRARGALRRVGDVLRQLEEG